MKQLFLLPALFFGLLLSSCGSKDGQSNIALSNDTDSLSYAFGVNLGEQFKQDPTLNLAIVGQAIKDIEDNKAKMTGQEAYAYLQMFQQKERQRQMQQQSDPEVLKQFEEKNKAAGEKFLNDNKSKANVVTLPSGLQYKIVKQGNGPKPNESDVVEVHYKGTLIDGTEFDSSYSRGETATFPLTGVIKGWTEGLQHINEGSKVLFYIPQELAYGATPRPGGPIEPYMALIFEIELIKVIPQNN